MPESVCLPAQEVPNLRELSRPSLLGLKEKIAEGAEEENEEHAPDPDRVIPAPETLPPGKIVELGGSVETSPNSADASPHITKTPIVVINTGEGEDLDGVEPVQSTIVPRGSDSYLIGCSTRGWETR